MLSENISKKKVEAVSKGKQTDFPDFHSNH